MLLCLKQAKVVDPANTSVSVVRDLWVQSGQIIDRPAGRCADQEIDLSGMIAMPGAIDLHTHIGGGKLAIARTLLPERFHETPHRSNDVRNHGNYAPGAIETGCRYAEMGYTACFEPAMLASGARQTHLELGDIPILDTGSYVMMGNEDLLLRRLAENAAEAEIADLVAWTMQATGALAVKVVNPAGIDAFKFGAKHLDVDEPHPRFGVTPRRVVSALAKSLEHLGIPHPLHVHCSNLGIAGNWQSTLATAAAAEGHPIHLTHVQFHSYGKEGSKGFSSRAAEIAELVNQHPSVSIDVGQIVFGQTVTVSADVMHQFAARHRAKPRKSVFSHLECQSGCGVVPFRYRDTNFIHALQWAIGLELLLLVNDPWRVFLTTDHPNGGPFTAYPHLIRMLMDRSYRESQLARINVDAAAASSLKGLTREYTLEEIAILTRAAPAKILGLQGHGHLGPSAVANIVAYQPQSDLEKMFAKPAWVFKDGVVVARDGQIVATVPGARHRVTPAFSPSVVPRVTEHLRQRMGVGVSSLAITADELSEMTAGRLVNHPCRHQRKI